MGKRGVEQEWNEKDAELVKHLAFAGYTQKEIAETLERSVNTLKKYYRKEWIIGSRQMVANVAGALYKRAMSKSDIGAIAIMNNVGPWRRGGNDLGEEKKVVIEITAKGQRYEKPPDFD